MVCYNDLEVRCLYGASSSRMADAVLVASGGMAVPTDATPGSECKVMVLEQRAMMRQPLFHPFDAKHGDED